MTDVIVAVITGGLALVGVIFSNMQANKKMEHTLEVAQAVTNTKLEALTKEVEKHNQVIERTFRLEGRVNELEHDVRDLKG